MTDQRPKFTQKDVMLFLMRQLEEQDPRAQAIQADLEKGDKSIARQMINMFQATMDAVIYSADEKLNSVPRPPQSAPKDWRQAYHDTLAQERVQGLSPSRN